MGKNISSITRIIYLSLKMKLRQQMDGEHARAIFLATKEMENGFERSEYLEKRIRREFRHHLWPSECVSKDFRTLPTLLKYYTIQEKEEMCLLCKEIRSQTMDQTEKNSSNH